MATLNKQVMLAARPVGFPKESDFRFVESPIPKPGAGEVLVRTIYLSVDPYMRGRMSEVKSYAPSVEIGGVMVGGGVGQVVESNHPQFQAGDYVVGMLGWQQYAAADGKGLRKLDPRAAPLAAALNVLGHIGLTAYFGLLDVCDPQPGETVVVSGAAGAVGSIAGQIAKVKDCRVVGIAGSEAKIDWVVRELGFDAAFNYKAATDYYEKLKELCPKGIDVYFDNVGGALTDAVFRLINVHARISICGQISQYNLDRPEMGPRFLPTLIVKRAKVQGFLITDYAPRFGEGLQKLGQWLKEGKLKYLEAFAEGIENAPRAFLGVLRGENIGKQLVKVSEP